MKKNILIYLLIGILFVWVGILSTRKSEIHSNTVTEEITVQGFSTDLTSVYDEHSSEVVTVINGDNLQTGVVYGQSNDGVYVLTCYHGVSNAEDIEVLFGKTYRTDAVLLGFDFYTDLAVIKVDTPYEIKTIEKGDSSLLKHGEFLLSVGTPSLSDYSGSLELGIISLNRIVLDNTIIHEGTQYNYYLDTVSFTSNIKQGYSGSPIYNMGGQVVGISTMASSSTRFAVTINEAKIVADSIINGESIHRNIFGAKVLFVKDLLNYEKANMGLSIDTIEGMYVENVKADTIMSACGIEAGDIILSINGIKTNDLDSYLQSLYLNDQTFEVSYIRNGVEAVTSISVNND